MTCGEHGGPICQVAGCLGSLRHAQDQHAQQSVPCHVVVDVMIVHAARHGSPTRPALSILFYASHAVQSARRRAPEVEFLSVRFFSITQY